MAGVAQAGNPAAEQLRLIAQLRWRIFANGLRGRRGKADLVARIISGILIGGGAFVFGFVLAAGSWAALHRHRPLILPAELWLVFLVWQLLPVFITGFGAQADLGLLLRFPVRYSTFVALTLAYGVTDPACIAALYWLAMILAGAALAAPAALLWAIPALGLFAVVNLLLSRSVFAWLDRWLAQRRTREILGVAFLLLMVGFQLIGPLTRRWGKRAESGFARIEPVQRVLPPGLSAYAIESGAGRGPLAAVSALGGLAGTAALFAWLLGVRLRAQYRGENLSEERREKAGPALFRGHRGAVARHRGWQLAGVSPTIAALFEKDLRYFLRNTTQYMALAAPVILVAVFSLNGGGRQQHRILGGAAFFPVSVGYCLLILSSLAFNSLGYDGAGVGMLFAAPVPFRDVLFSKNLLHGLLVSTEITLVSTVVIFLAGPPSPLIAAITLSGAVFVILASLTAGNLASLYFPRRLQFGATRRQNQSGVAMLVAVFVPATCIGFVAGVYALCRWAGSLGWALLVLAVLVVASFVVYRRVLVASSAIADRKRDVLMEELCKTQ